MSSEFGERKWISNFGYYGLLRVWHEVSYLETTHHRSEVIDVCCIMSQHHTKTPDQHHIRIYGPSFARPSNFDIMEEPRRGKSFKYFKKYLTN